MDVFDGGPKRRAEECFDHCCSSLHLQRQHRFDRSQAFPVRLTVLLLMILCTSTHAHEQYKSAYWRQMRGRICMIVLLAGEIVLLCPHLGKNGACQL